ncbi:Serine threonine protein kinase-related and IKI3 domain containing protein [Aphelenchoides bicaudatus]|nr:Serine threonine protein kinase-related and IKI3 domain containing protein [Aphelenchoides bicaudatus]
MNRTFTVCDANGKSRYDLEADEVTLLFLDTLMAQLNAGTAEANVDFEYADYFEYEDEEGDKMAVRTDEELNSMLLSCDPSDSIRIFLKSSKPIQKASCSLSKIKPGQLHRLERLGSGKFGTVYRVIDENDQEFAVKCLSDTNDQATNMNLLNEIEILKKCKSPYIVEFYGASLEEGEWLIRLELMDGSSLDRYQQLPVAVLGSVSVAIISGLKYLWSLKIMHRDIKPSNFLVNTKGDIKLSDFGVSRQMLFSAIFSNVGTNRYLAPERIAEYSDVWSLGLALAEMALGRFPIGSTHNEWLEFIMSRQNPSVDVQFCGQSFQELIDQCLQIEPERRPKPEHFDQMQFIIQNTPINKLVVAKMKNVNLYCAEQVLSPDVSSKVEGSKFVCVDYATGRVFFLSAENLIIVEQNGADHEIVALNLIHEVSGNSPVVLFDYLHDSSELCFICRSGHVFTYDLIEKSLSERGCIIDEVWGGSWSPDFQTLVIATKNLLISISRDFDTIDEIDLFPKHAGREELQTLGWGSKQTQFQGQAGKANREKLDLDRVPTKLHQWDNVDYNTLVCWRPDAQILVTSTIEEISHEALRDENGEHNVLGRRVRVWDRNLQLLSCCDVLAGIEPTLALRPGKSLILTSRLYGYEDEKQTRSLWFFEQNGQYFNNSLLPVTEDAIVKRLQWNADGSILMVAVQYPKLGKDQLQFWTISNAEWALKSALDFTDRIVECFFLTELSLIAYCLTASGKLWKFEMARVYNCVDGIAVSVCEDNLRFTDFNKAPIPPPMCHSNVKLPKSSENNYEFTSSLALNEKAQLVTLSSMSNLHFYKLKDLTAQHTRSISCRHLNNGILYGINWATHDETTVTLCFCDSTDWKVFAVCENEFRELYVSKTPIVYQVLSGEKLFVVDMFSKCIIFNLTNQKIEHSFETKTRSFFDWKLLSPRHALMYNDKIILDDCTSFSVTSTEDFIVASTFSHKLLLLNLNSFEKEQASTAGYIVGEGRLIERGANIIGHEPGSTGIRCVLQMPRGNLEQVCPRDLLIERTKTLIDRHEFRNALKEMRRHRLNMNLIFDHNPSSFLDSVPEFVKQFDTNQQLDTDLLQLFVASLEEDDCTRTLFARSYNNSPLVSKNAPAFTIPDKVEKVCKLLLEQIKASEPSMDPRAFEQIYTVILSCYVKPKESKRVQFLSNSLRHLCYSVQESILFDAALRTYDLNIVSMIADKQQKDPREYLPIIAELKSKTPEEYRNYFICVRLQDWSQALKHLAKVPERFDECLDLIKQHSLYVDALSILTIEICQIYADYLLAKSEYQLAAIFFEKCQNWEKSLKSLECGRLSNEFIQFYSRLDNEQKDLLKNNYTIGLKKMAVQLEQYDQFRDVAEVLKSLDIEANLKKVLEMYAKAGDWSKLVNIGREYKQLELAADLLKQRSHFLLTLFDEWTSTLKDRHSRLLVLRQLKAKQLEEWTEASGDVDLGQSETMSEASTMSNISRMSTVSTVSSRKRKNIQKKKANIKEGSHYEDSAILLSLKKLCLSIDELQDEMVQLLPALLALDLIDEAKQIHEKFDWLLSECQHISKSIWPEFLKPATLPGPIYETYRGEDGIIRMPVELGALPTRIRMDDELIPPIFRKNVQWKLSHFV